MMAFTSVEAAVGSLLLDLPSPSRGTRTRPVGSSVAASTGSQKCRAREAVPLTLRAQHDVHTQPSAQGQHGQSGSSQLGV